MTMTLEDPVVEAVLDALFEAGAKGVAWDGMSYGVLVTDEEVQGAQSNDGIGPEGGLEVDGIRRLFGDEDPLVEATAEFEAAYGRGLFDGHFAGDEWVLATPAGIQRFQP